MTRVSITITGPDGKRRTVYVANRRTELHAVHDTIGWLMKTYGPQFQTRRRVA